MVLLDIDDLSVRYETGTGEVHAIDDVSISIDHGEIFGLVGESGCGKTTLGKSILRLLDGPGYIDSGHIRFHGRDLAGLSAAEMRDVRWAQIALITQESMSGLNPVYTVGDQIVEAIRRHRDDVAVDEAHTRARDLLERVGVAPHRADDYPHQLSGGMKQRSMIAMALACDPDLLIADEPTTALDVIVQDQVLEELEAIQAELDMAVLLISHDISVIAETCDRVGVMYGGKLMEVGTTAQVFDDPANPYTMGLKRSFPTIGADQKELVAIPGQSPDLQNPPSGCRFRPRCPFATETCTTDHPPLHTVGGDHASACYHVDKRARMQTEADHEQTWD